jgi:hypothetical protein
MNAQGFLARIFFQSPIVFKKTHLPYHLLRFHSLPNYEILRNELVYDFHGK